MFRLTLIKSDQSARYDITPIVGEISWDSNFSLMAALQMDVVYSDTAFFPKNPCDVGDHVILIKEDTEVFRGVIVDETRQNRESIKYEVYDYAWYLCESKIDMQFNRVPARTAIERVLAHCGIEVGYMSHMTTIIDKIYMMECPACIIQEILHKVEAQEGYTVNVDMREGKIYFNKRQDLLITGNFRLAPNVPQSNVLDAVLDAKRTRSIKEMRNRIRLIVEEPREEDAEPDAEPVYEVTAEKEDAALIERYGLLEETFELDPADAAKSRQVARILLRRLGRVHETNEIELIGDIRFIAGRLFDVIEPITGMDQRYMISNAKHTVKNQHHTMRLELVLPEDVI